LQSKDPSAVTPTSIEVSPTALNCNHYPAQTSSNFPAILQLPSLPYNNLTSKNSHSQLVRDIKKLFLHPRLSTMSRREINRTSSI
jgi:hypothetical protein